MTAVRTVLFICGLLFSFALSATHNRAGEITYRHLGGYQYEVTIITYTKSDSPADRPDLPLSWGDNTIDTIPRVNGGGMGEIVAPTIKKNVYVGVHTYPAPAIYTLSFEDANRNGGVVNIPNSVNIPFFVSTQLIINPFLGINNSVQLLNPPIDEACPGQVFVHNPGAYDPDGDSLSYRLVECLGEEGLPIPGFVQPQATNFLSIDAITGDLVWDTPPPNGLGEYNVAFVIEEWRNGILIGFVTRDMQIDVVPCNNRPPVISPLPDLCVDAGTIISFPVNATDSDNPVQEITLSATGGPMFFAAPFTAIFAPQTGNGSVSQTFTWPTDCKHVRKQPYLISFKVIDGGQPMLSDYESVQIKVVAPAPQNLTATPQGTSIVLQWDASLCSLATGYAIYRKNGPYGFIPSPCETGVPAYTGYTFLDTVNNINTTDYTDSGNGSGLVPGMVYCYMVIAVFPDGAESYASNEACASLAKELPVITNISIRNTSETEGKIDVAWSKPIAIDSTQWPGPFRYLIERAEGFEGDAFTVIESIDNLNDTIYIDSSDGLNTVSTAWHYRITLQNLSSGSPEDMGASFPASSVFLTAQGLDNSIALSWSEIVPWVNNSYIIYRQNPLNLAYDSIAVSVENTFTDTGLANGATYCYHVKSFGGYPAGGFIDPILNFSQDVCASPVDLEPPCPPLTSVSSSCVALRNEISWSFSQPECSADAVEFRIYFSPNLNDSLALLATLPYSTLPPYVHLQGNSVAGCYAVSAVDSFQNESELTKFCVDNCPVYELPNTFSPNGDGSNDLFRPFPYAFIDAVEMHIFNRWGQEVFSSTVPDLLWNGKAKSTGAFVPDGVYFYVCSVKEIRLQGIVKREIKGTIQVIGSKNYQTD